MKPPVLGVIGGLGAMATTYFLEETEAMTDWSGEQVRLRTIVSDFPAIPDRTGYLRGSNLRNPLPGLLRAGRELTGEGVCAIALPSIIAHFFLEELTERLCLPVPDAIRETALHLKEQGVVRAGVLATRATVDGGLFLRDLLEAGISPVFPAPETQEGIDQLIFRDLKTGRPPETDAFYRAEEELRRRGAQVVVLGCMELTALRKKEQLGPGFLDATQILAKAALEHCGLPLRPECRNLITK